LAIRKVLILFLIWNKYSFHSPYAIPWPEPRRWMRRRYHTEAKSFSLLTQPSLFIFCLRPLARRWPVPSGELQATSV